MAALIAVTAVIVSLTAAAGKKPDYIGSWVLSGDKNADNIGDIYTMFGSSLRHYGAGLDIGADGRLDFFLGLTGGDGKYTVEGDVITAELHSYAENRLFKKVFKLVQEDGKLYIVSKFDYGDKAVDVWWEKKPLQTSG